MRRQIVVIGLGRFGSTVAESLYNLGHDVLAIDSDQGRAQRMMGRATHVIAGNATDESVLRELGIPDYDVAIVAIGSDIVSSIMTSVLLKTMGVKYIVARAQNELHGSTLERVGVDKVVHTETEMGVRLAHSLFNPDVLEYMELAPSFGISKMRVPERFGNMSLTDLGLSGSREKNGLAVLAVRRGKDITLNPDAADRLQPGDWLVVAGRDDLLDQLETKAK